MVAHPQSSADQDQEPVLHSSYKSVPIPTLTSQSACELILQKSKLEVAAGRTKWLTDTVSGFTLNYADIEPMTRQAASAMAKRGMVRGDVAIYLTMDVTRIFTTIMGVWRLGGVMQSSYPEDTSETLLTRIQQSKAKWIFCDPVSVPQVKNSIKDLEWEIEIIVFFDHVEGTTSIDQLYEDDGADCPSKIETTLNDPLLILCTSGTTGKSKGAIYTNRCVLAFCLGTAGIPRNKRPALLMLRCTHVLGCLFPIRNICMGISSIMMSQVTKVNIFKAVDEHKPSLAFGFPTFLQLLTTPEAEAYDRSSLEIICAGGVVLTPQYHDIMMTLPNVKLVMNGWGMTECAALTTTLDLSGTDGFRLLPNVPHLSVGRLYPNTSLKVIDVDSGRALGPNQKGELVVRSPIMSVGYWKQPEENEATFLDEGWLRTGDLGYYNSEGFIFVVDRVKETFKYFNNHISPAELEEILLRHPDVEEASCFGLHDPEGGDHIPRAAVVLKPRAQACAEEIQNFVDSQVASYKRLRGGLFIVPALPRGKTGKVMRSMVATMALAA